MLLAVFVSPNGAAPEARPGLCHRHAYRDVPGRSEAWGALLSGVQTELTIWPFEKRYAVVAVALSPELNAKL